MAEPLLFAQSTEPSAAFSAVIVPDSSQTKSVPESKAIETTG